MIEKCANKQTFSFTLKDKTELLLQVVLLASHTFPKILCEKRGRCLFCVGSAAVS